MAFFTRRFFTGALCLALAASAAAPALAQEPWKPTRPIKIVVPFPPGGGGDIITRLVAKSMEASLGQAIVVENRPGASGSIGSDATYRAAPDGYTLLSASLDAQAMYPHVGNVPFDPARFVPVGGMAQMPYVLMGRPDLPASNLSELRQLMRGKTLTYASGGSGSSLHVFAELLAREAGSPLLHVPYQGAGPGIQALLGGQVDLMMVPLAVAPQHRAKLRAYGVTSAQRAEAMKDVPTLKEQGVNVVGDSWAALLAPPGTPESVVESLSQALRQAVGTPEVSQKLRELGMTPITMTRRDFAQFYGAEYRRWGDVIKSARIRAQ
jgi:tripartite-type tricarboxylate transporter receptor subunit TctC